MEKRISIELGCENLRVAVVDSQGKILHQLSAPTNVHQGYDTVMSRMIALIKQLRDVSSCTHIGIGVPGPIDADEGILTMATNLTGFDHKPIKKDLETAFSIPCHIENDVNVAALAEARYGAGKGYRSLYYISLSTGIGGAYVLAGHILRGTNGYAGEIGNIIIDQNRDKYNHLNIGAVENEASGNAITREGKCYFGDDIVQNAGDVFAQARLNDPIAIKLCDDFSKDLAVMMSTIAHVIDPQVFIFGGGCMKSADMFFSLMEERFRSLIHERMRHVEVKKAQLQNPGLLGAALLPEVESF